MNDHRLLLVKCITLLYRESMISEKESNSCDLVRTVLEGIKLPEISITMNSERDLLAALKDTALYMCGNPVDTVYERDELMQRLKVNCGIDEKLYEAFSQGIERDMDDGSLKRTILSIRKFLNDTFRENEIAAKIHGASNKLRFQRDTIKDVREFVKTLTNELEPYQIEANRKDPAVVDMVDLGDTASLAEQFSEVAADENSSTILKAGWQDLNIMTQGGMRRAETVVIPALQHKYKTGFTLSLFRQLCTLNIPKLTNPNKKPLMLRISFEDSLLANIVFLYQNIIENETGKLPVIEKKWPNEEARKEYLRKLATYVKEKMEVTGYHVKMMRVNPSMWSLRDLQNTILSLEADGYEIHCCMVDYLPMMPTTGCDQGPAGADLQNMVQRARNFFSAKNILFISPWQLSSEAKMLVREGRTDFVKFVAEKGYYKGCKSIDQEVDLEIYIHIEKFNGQAWLTVQRGKHRLPTIISDDEKYFCLPFPEKGSIPDDYGKERIGRSKIGGGPKGSPEELPFFEFSE